MNADSNNEIGGIYKEYAGVVNQALTGAEKYKINCKLEIFILLLNFYDMFSSTRNARSFKRYSIRCIISCRNFLFSLIYQILSFY